MDGTKASTTQAESLRALADFIDEHPEIGTVILAAIATVYVPSREKMARHAPSIGVAAKKADEFLFSLVRDFGNYVRFELSAYRSQVCERVVVTSEQQVERPACPECLGDLEVTPSGATVCREHGSEHYRAVPPAKRVVTETVERVEWDCPDSILRPEPVRR